MKFRTEIEPLRFGGMIDHSAKIIMVGSCFTDEVGARLSNGGFEVDVNPFGTLYNPESMALEIERTLRGDRFNKDDFFEENGRWHSFRRHSRFSSSDPEEMQMRLNGDCDRIAAELKDATHLIVTFGSAILFRHILSGDVVANCHKVPSNQFKRETIGVQEITERWTALIDMLRQVNPGLKIIMTVSPVRHSGYGLIADRVSKSTLLLACNMLASSVKDAIYFPSYEIMVDDLRDYRFYKDDLIHPSEMAVDYIYNIFCESFMSAATIERAKTHEKEARRNAHRQIL